MFSPLFLLSPPSDDVINAAWQAGIGVHVLIWVSAARRTVIPTPDLEKANSLFVGMLLVRIRRE